MSRATAETSSPKGSIIRSARRRSMASRSAAPTRCSPDQAVVCLPADLLPHHRRYAAGDKQRTSSCRSAGRSSTPVSPSWAARRPAQRTPKINLSRKLPPDHGTGVQACGPRTEGRQPVSTIGGETSQTLDRGLTVLSLLATHSDGLTAAELAEHLSTARAVVYRLLRTLEAHRLVGRIDTRYVLGFGVAELASRLRPRLQTTVLPILRRLSQQTNSTALVSVADGDQALILITEEPPESTLHLAVRQGARHPLDRGADGVAILAGRPATPDDAKDVHRARQKGYALSVR